MRLTSWNKILIKYTNGIHLLEQNIHKIIWSYLSANTCIFEYDHQAMKDRMYNSGLCEELMANRFHPDNSHKWVDWGFEDMVPDGLAD